MFGSQILDIAIGMVFVYLALSLLCSGINEWIAHLLNRRAKHLEEWIYNLLSGDQKNNQLVQDFQNHPLIKALSKSGKKPSYIPSNTFMLVLLDVIAPVNPATGSRTIESIRESVKQLPESDVQRTLLALMDDAGNDINIIRDHIEGWFNDAMERLSGWYKRRTQWVLLALAIGISIGLNVDTFRVYSGLYRDSTTRAAVVAAAQRIAQQPPATSDQTPLTQVGQVQEELQQLNIPMGWSDPKQRPDFSDPLAILAALIGWLITGFAAAQGAPFWFDTLNKLVNVRSTGQRPETTAKPEPQSAPQVVIQSAAPTTDRQKPGEPILKVSS